MWDKVTDGRYSTLQMASYKCPGGVYRGTRVRGHCLWGRMTGHDIRSYADAENAGPEYAGPANVKPNVRTGKCRTGIYRTKYQDRNIQCETGKKEEHDYT